MATPFLGEIKIFAMDFAPRGWAFCNGQTLPINQNQALFALVGTTYGGNGTSNFKLPSLQGRTAVGQGAGFTLGQTGGEANHTLVSAEMPAHTHTFSVSNIEGTTDSPADAAPGAGGTKIGSVYYKGSANTAMAANAMRNAGGSPHTNMQPFLALNFCIALSGIFPSRN